MKNEYGLTPKQEAFARALVEGMSQADAYRAAYPACKAWKVAVVHVKASVMAADGKVRARVAGLQAELAERSVLRAEDILRETERIALATPAGLVKRYRRPGEKTDRLEMLMPDELSPAMAAAVKSFEIDELGRAKYTLWDKNVSLDRATKIRGLYTKDNEQKAGSLAALLAALSGNVVRPDPASALPEDGDDDA